MTGAERHRIATAAAVDRLKAQAAEDAWNTNAGKQITFGGQMLN